MSRALWGIVVAVLVAGAAAQARPAVRAARAAHPILLDGKLDEVEWAAAPAFTDFVDSFPVEGKTPSEKTAVRVLYDDDNLYVGVICFDTHPEQIVRQLGRRDNIPASDVVAVAVDSQHDRRTAEAFIVNAAGVKKDQLLFDDVNGNDGWDAVWDVAVAARPDGWSAEFAIPLHLLRFSSAPVQTWGLLVHREIPRTHEQIDLTEMPRSANGFVSRFGELDGLEHLRSQRDLEVTPYVAARASVQPRYVADDRPQPRLLNPSVDVGMNLKASLGSSLTLNAAINPDFGEIEPDALQLNLTHFELFYPELRPFFTEGLELFDSTVAGQSDQRLFYSRRIGLDAPLLGAAKLTGAVAEGLTMSVLDAVVTGVGDPAKQPYAYGNNADPDQAPLDRRFELHWQQPFHFGPNNELPAERPVPTNFFALAARQKLGSSSSVGATVTSAVPLGTRCDRSDFVSDADYRAADCDAAGGNAAALDWNLRTANGDWAVLGQLSGSRRLGGPAEGLTRDDGTVLHGGDMGFGTFVRAGKLGGEPWQFNVAYLRESPKLDLNASGYQSQANRQQVMENLFYNRPSGDGHLHSYSFWLNGQQGWTADGRGIPGYLKLDFGADVTLPNYLYLGMETGYERPNFDVNEITGSGAAFERNEDAYLVLMFNTDGQKAFQTGGNFVGYRVFGNGSAWGHRADVWGRLRPTASLETYLELAANWSPEGMRYIDSLDDTHFVFSPQNARAGSLTLRQQWVLSPTFTLQAYAQLFTAWAHYGSFFEGSPDASGRVRQASLTPTRYDGNPDFHDAALNVSVVARWQYRLGSTVFLVYSRTQQALPFGAQSIPQTLAPENLAHGRTDDTFLVKWSYWYDA